MRRKNLGSIIIRHCSVLFGTVTVAFNIDVAYLLPLYSLVRSLSYSMAELPVTPTFSRAILAAAEADKQNSSRCGRVLSAVLSMLR